MLKIIVAIISDDKRKTGTERKIIQFEFNARVKEDLFGQFHSHIWYYEPIPLTKENIKIIEDNFTEILEGTRIISSTPKPSIQRMFSDIDYKPVSPYGNKEYSREEIKNMDKLIKTAKKHKGKASLWFSEMY